MMPFPLRHFAGIQLHLIPYRRSTMAAYELIAPPGSFAQWPAGLAAEMAANRMSAVVGSTLVSETDRLRTFHRHVLDYFWTCHTHGRARGYYEDGSITEATHFPGDTRHLTYARDEHLVHSVENIGASDLLFTTVEFKDSANAALPVPDEVRLKGAA
jgi:beta-alanine degradation protein BauB